jgi:hypothetical protein
MIAAGGTSMREKATTERTAVLNRWIEDQTAS